MGGGQEGVPTLPSFYFGGHFQEGFSPMDFSVGPRLTAFPPERLLRVSCSQGSCAEQVNKYFCISRWDSVCHEVPRKFRLEKLGRKALTWVVAMSLPTLTCSCSALNYHSGNRGSAGSYDLRRVMLSRVSSVFNGTSIGS